jgi:hypothetical protein
MSAHDYCKGKSEVKLFIDEKILIYNDYALGITDVHVLFLELLKCQCVLAIFLLKSFY